IEYTGYDVMELTYDGLDIWLGREADQRQFTVDSVEIWSERWDIEGLRIGMDAAEMRVLLGNPVYVDQNEATYPIDGVVELTIQFEDGRISSIFVSGDTC